MSFLPFWFDEEVARFLVVTVTCDLDCRIQAKKRTNIHKFLLLACFMSVIYQLWNKNLWVKKIMFCLSVRPSVRHALRWLVVTVWRHVIQGLSFCCLTPRFVVGVGGIFRLHTVPYWLHSRGSGVLWFLIWFLQLRTFRLVQSRESKIKNNLKIKQM